MALEWVFEELNSKSNIKRERAIHVSYPVCTLLYSVEVSTGSLFPPEPVKHVGLVLVSFAPGQGHAEGRREQSTRN